MNILLASLELFPFVKVGGIADAVAGIAKTLAARGHRVTIALPRRDGTAIPTELAPALSVAALDVPGFASGDLYGHDVMESVEEAARQASLSRAVMALVAARARAGDPFDIVHVHDWPLALVPYLLREEPAVSPSTRTILTIHNVAFQGIVLPEALASFGLGPEHLAEDRLLFHGRASMLKGGVVAADALTTVSPTYARDLLTPDHGQHLDGILRGRRDPVHGILNGIDTEVWNPATDPSIPARFSADDLGPKARCKSELTSALGLDADPSRPLFAHVGRLFFEKGSDVLAAALPGIVARGASIVVAGTGEAAMNDAMRAAAAACSDRARVLGWVTEEMVHRIFAAADALIVPSRIEPCGLVQMYAQRYGALPIARRTGGLGDTIVDLTERPTEGTGFLYQATDEVGLLGAVDRALAHHRSPGFAEPARRAMRLVRDWMRPASQYEYVYQVAHRPQPL